MDVDYLKANLPATPAFVLDEQQLQANLSVVNRLKQQSGCKVLYSIKALPLMRVMKLAKQVVDGFSVSSLFEARLANEVLAGEGSIHITTPGLRDEEYLELSELCTHISFNSISQYQRLNKIQHDACSLGLRVNPQSSFSSDLRYDPCRPFSKLGTTIPLCKPYLSEVEGLHVHNVFSHVDYYALNTTVAHIKNELKGLLSELKWLNLGGGYLFNQIDDHQPFIDLVTQLKNDYLLDVIIEPGKAIVGNAAYIVTTVIDQFISDGKQICVLDTSINHNPEVFEYQTKPVLMEHDSKGILHCLLVGSSCLSGDLFGDYQFKQLPKVGDRLVFSNVGAYSLIKANRFNGYNFPDVYSINKHNEIKCIQQSNYQQYRQQWKEL